MRWLFGLLLLVGLAASAFASGIDIPTALQNLQRWLVGALPLDQAWWALATVVTLSVAGGVLGFPVTLMIALSAMLFGAIPGMLYSLSGCIAGAMLAYAVGHRLDPHGKAIEVRHLRALHQKLSRGGLSTIVLLRLFPLLPFALVNLAAGATRMRWGNYVVGTALGMLPSIVLISLLMGRIRPVHAEMTSLHFGPAMAALGSVFFAAWTIPLLLRRFFAMETQQAFYLQGDSPQPSLTPSTSTGR